VLAHETRQPSAIADLFLVRPQRIIHVKILVLLFFAFGHAALGAGGSESIVARMNGWTVTLRSASGSDAYIEKSVGKEHYNAMISFPYFWDYYSIFLRLPRAAKGQKSDFYIEDTNPGSPLRTPIRAEYARPIMELMLLNFRQQFESFEPEKVQKELNANPPISKELMPNDTYKFVVKPR
jgi:hypothetical protein